MAILKSGKKAVAMLSAFAILLLSVPAILIQADSSTTAEYLAEYDPFAEIDRIAREATIADEIWGWGTVDYSGSHFSVYGSYDWEEKQLYSMTAVDSQKVYLSCYKDGDTPPLNNSVLEFDTAKNAMASKQAYNGDKGNMIQVVFTAPKTGTYLVVPGAVGGAEGHSLQLVPAEEVNTPGDFTQTFAVKKGEECLFSQSLGLSVENTASVTGDIADDIRVDLERGEELRFEYTAPVNWAPSRLYASFKIVLEEVAPASPVTGIELNKTEVSIPQGSRYTLAATVLPSNADDTTVSYESSNPAVAEVDGGGVITAKSIGEAVITAISNGNPDITATCRVTVTGPAYNAVSSLQSAGTGALSDNEAAAANFANQFSAGVLNAGEYSDFQYVIPMDSVNNPMFTNIPEMPYDNKASNQHVQFFSNDYLSIGSYAENNWVYTGFTADTDGLYTLKPNENYPCITFMYMFGANSAQDLVDWNQDAPFYVRVTRNGEKVWPQGDEPGYRLQPSVTASVAMPTLKDIELYKGDILRVEVLGSSSVEGWHVVVNYNYDIALQEPISVAVPVEKVSFPQKQYQISIGQKLQLSAAVTPANASNPNLDWLSSDPDIVNVSPSGKILALKQGMATIWAISKENEAVKDSCEITVTSHEVLEYTPDELVESLNRQLNGQIVVESFPVEFDTNWTAHGLSSDGQWKQLLTLTTNHWSDEKKTDEYAFKYTWGDIVGFERLGNYYQPYLMVEDSTVALTFTATRAGTYTLSPDARNQSIRIPDTFINGRMPEEDRDKNFTFKIYLNDKVLYSAKLNCLDAVSVPFPTLENLYMKAGDVIRFAVEDAPAAKLGSQIDIYFSPVVSFMAPDTTEYAPVASDSEYTVTPNTVFTGKINVVHPNGYSVQFEDLNAGSNKLVISANGEFTYTPAKNYKGVDKHKIKITDIKGKSCTVTLTFLVANVYNGVELLSKTLLTVDPEASGGIFPLDYGDAIWKIQYTYTGLTYSNGVPKYFDTNTVECIRNAGWWGYSTYTTDCPQATIYDVSGSAAVEIMAGHKPWGASPIGAMTFISPSDSTYLLRGDKTFNKFLATYAADDGFKEPMKVWITKNGEKIWPVDSDAIVLSRETCEVEFPELTVAMKRGDNLRICVTGHVDNERTNCVAFAPVMYDIGQYVLLYDPNTDPEGGRLVTDDDGEPMVNYNAFSLNGSDDTDFSANLLEPIVDEGYTVDKIKNLSWVEPFTLRISYDRCEGAAGYLVTVYRHEKDGYTIFREETVSGLSSDISSFSEGKYTIQVMALDKFGQYMEIYTAREFEVDREGNFIFVSGPSSPSGFNVLAVVVIVVAVLAAAAAVIVICVFIYRRKKGGRSGEKGSDSR